MRSFKEMTNECIRIGLGSDASTLRRLSLLSYHGPSEYCVPSYYKPCAISRAAGMLASRKKSIRREYQTMPAILSRCLEGRRPPMATQNQLSRRSL